MSGRARLWMAMVATMAMACAYDPAPGITQTKTYSRNLECTRLSQAQAHVLFPGKVPDLPPRGSHRNIDALSCSTRLTDLKDRPARDEVILTSLRQTVEEITQLASARAPNPTTWYVDAFYPNVAVAQKISTAAKTFLAERGHAVSDRVPVLAAGDIAVLARMPPGQAYPLACKRYFDHRVLIEPDVFLGLMIIDARQTDLHAGLCVRGEWKWLR